MNLTFKFRLYPSKEQERRMLLTLDRCRLVYNHMLGELRNQEKPDRYELQNSIPKLKESYPELKQAYAKVLQYELYRLFSNLRALARLKKNGKKVGKLRFKGKAWFKTFTYNQYGFKIIITGKRFQILHLSKIGEIPIRMHRKIKGQIKQVTVKRSRSGKWFACIQVEMPEDKRSVEGGMVGIDLGIESFVYDSNGEHTESPKYLEKSLYLLRKEQRKLSKRKKGSANRGKQRIRLARIHEKIFNQRDDFLHKISRHYVNRYKLIAVENLNIKGLIRISYNARNILDSSWNKFLKFLEYKAVRASVSVVRVNPSGTTQRCSNCGRLVPKELKDRTHKCICGIEIPRDFNSARMILARAIGREPSEYTPVETEPLLGNQQVQSMKQEATGL